MAGIRIRGGSNISIINCKFDRCDIAIHATDTHNLRIDKTYISSCEKGIGLYDCWDSDISDTSINQSLLKRSTDVNRFKLTEITSLVKYYMIYG